MNDTSEFADIQIKRFKQDKYQRNDEKQWENSNIRRTKTNQSKKVAAGVASCLVIKKTSSLNGNRHDKDDSISGISIIKSSINYIIQKIFDPKVVGIVAIAIPVAIAALIVYRKRLSNSLLKEEDDDVVSHKQLRYMAKENSSRHELCVLEEMD